MPFQLNVTFSGMCLLVHDRDSDRLQVLMPPTGTVSGGHHGHGMDVHLPRLGYYGDRLKPNGGERGGVQLIKLEDVLVEFPGIRSTDAFHFEPSPDVLNVNEITGRTVPKSLFGPLTGGRVLSRVTLDKGRERWHHPGARWDIGRGAPEQMAIATTWTVDEVQGDTLEVNLTGLNGSRTAQRLTLYPDTEGRLNLHVFHAPADEIRTDELPRCWPGQEPWRVAAMPSPDDTADHFAAFYTLYDPLPVPRFVDRGAAGEKSSAAPEALFGSKFTCGTGAAST